MPCWDENPKILDVYRLSQKINMGIHSKVLWWMAITLKILCLEKLMIGNYRSRNHIPKSKCDTLLGKGEKVGMSKNRYCLSSSKEFPKGCVLFQTFRCHCILNRLFWKTIHYTTTPDSWILDEKTEHVARTMQKKRVVYKLCIYIILIHNPPKT